QIVMRAREAFQPILAVDCRLHFVALFTENIHDQLSHRALILDNQDAAREKSARFARRCGQYRRTLRLRMGNYRKFDQEFRAGSGLAFECDLSIVLLDDSIDDRESQASAHTGGLGREKRVED